MLGHIVSVPEGQVEGWYNHIGFGLVMDLKVSCIPGLASTW